MKRALALTLSVILVTGTTSFSGMSEQGGQYFAIEAAAAETQAAEAQAARAEAAETQAAEAQAARSEAAAGDPSETVDEFPEQSETIAEIAEQISDPENDPFDYTTEDARAEAVAAAADTYPDAFDLRDVDGVSYVTPVKLQHPYGDCWGFAAIAAAETSILGDDALRGDYTADARREPGKIQMDLSEKHLSYFAGVPINDPDNTQNGEGDSPITTEGKDEVAEIYDVGGEAPTATSLFASGVGPVLESEDPLLEYKGKNGTIKKEWIDGKYRDFCYSPSPHDDWTLDESMRFMRSYELKESFFLPSPAIVKYVENEGNVYELNEAGVAAIKSQLLLKRGVEISYHDDTFDPLRGETNGRYINDNWAHYTFDPVGTTHSVCIVGYDDNYPAENFRHGTDNPEDYTEEDTVPPGDGAWLVRNSWGSGLEEFPNKGEGIWGIQEVRTDGNGDPVTDADGNPVMAGSGYFWLSYYDYTIETPQALAFERADETCDVIDQYDYMPIYEYSCAHVANEVRTANVFKAGVCEELRAVSCETTYPGTEVTFEVYLLADGYTDPADGLLMDTVTAGPFEYGGFHKVRLNKPFMVMRGQSYSIVVTQRVPEEGGGSSYVLGIRKSDLGNAVMNEGESLVFADGTWMDFSDVKVRAAVMGISEEDVDSYVYDNFPIKGYASEKPNVILEIGAQEKNANVIDDDAYPEVRLTAWITDGTGEDRDVVPTWRISEGEEEIAELVDDRDPASKTLRRHKPGGVYVIVTAEGIGTAVYSDRSFTEEPETGGDSVTLAATAKVRLTNVASGIKVSWEKVDGAKCYKVYRGSKFLFATSRLYGTDTAVKSDNGTKYTYKVVASTTRDDDSGDSPKARTSTGYRLVPVGIRTLTNSAAGRMTVTYGKNSKAYGYVVRYGLKSDMSDAKVITVKGADATSRTFSGLAKGKTYYVQVRTYKPENGVRYYSGYCTTKTVKIAK